MPKVMGAISDAERIVIATFVDFASVRQEIVNHTMSKSFGFEAAKASKLLKEQ
jgi:hypothetical protein